MKILSIVWSLALVLTGCGLGLSSKGKPSLLHEQEKEVTARFLRSASEYTDRGGQASLEALKLLADRRLELMKRLAEQDPAHFLVRAFPHTLVTKLPEEVQFRIERHLTVEGEIESAIADNLEAGSHFEVHSLKDAKGKVHRLKFSKEAPSYPVGTTLSLQGVAVGSTLVASYEGEVILSTNSVSNVAEESNTQALVTSQRVLGILINFSNKPFQSTREAVEQSLFSGARSAANYFNEVSAGQYTMTGDVVGPYTIDSTDQSCSSSTWATAALAAAQAAGVNTGAYDRYVLFFPHVSACSWSGLGTIGSLTARGTKSWLNGTVNAGVVAHELGHNLGLHHATSRNCGTAVLGSSCTDSEYGDPYSVMGGAGQQRHILGSSKTFLGWIPATNLTTVTASGTYRIAPIEVASSVAQVLRILKPDTANAYYITTRKSVGFDAGIPAGMVGGLSFHLWDGRRNTYFLDMTPGQTSTISPALAPNASYTDAVNGFTVQNSGYDAATEVTTVSVTFGNSTPVCTRNAPTLELSPLSQTGTPGQLLQYRVTVTNRDSAACPSASFSLNGSVPAGWMSAASPSSVTLSPGASASGTWSVTSDATAANNSYAVKMSVSGSSDSLHTAFRDATYVVFLATDGGGDTTDPTVSVTSPMAGAVLAGAVTLAATADDNVGVKEVRFYRDAGVLLGVDSVAPYAVSWASGSAENGQHQIYAVAVDAAGNEASSAQVGVTVNDVVAPSTVTITQPVDGARITKGTTVRIGATAPTGTSNVRFVVTDAYGNSRSGRDYYAPYGVNWSTYYSRRGQYRISATAYDANGTNLGKQNITVTLE